MGRIKGCRHIPFSAMSRGRHFTCSLLTGMVMYKYARHIHFLAYHIADLCLHRPALDLSVLASKAAHRVPPELIAHTVLHVMDGLSERNSHFLKPADGELKRWLGSCTLVCRYWGSLLRRVLFSRVQLRNEQDFNSLLGMLSIPGPAMPPLSSCLQMVIVFQSGPWAMPWVHRLSRIQDYSLNVLDWAISLRDLSDPRMARRLLEGQLPRTLPGSAFMVEILTLRNIHFRSVRDLVRAVGYLPSVTCLRCDSLSFDDANIPLGRVLPKRRQTRGGEYEVTIGVQNSGGAEAEREIMFKVLSELCHDTPMITIDDPLWGIFNELITAFPVPSLTASMIGM